MQLLRDESSTRLAACEMLESQLQELKRSEGNLQELRNLDYMRINRSVYAPDNPLSVRNLAAKIDLPLQRTSKLADSADTASSNCELQKLSATAATIKGQYEDECKITVYCYMSAPTAKSVNLMPQKISVDFANIFPSRISGRIYHVFARFLDKEDPTPGVTLKTVKTVESGWA